MLNYKTPMRAFLLTGLLGAFTSGQAASILLPADAAGPLGSASAPGFLVRTVQGPQTPALANSVMRAVRQLNGTLLDADGNPVVNEAIAGPNADGGYTLDAVGFERDGTSPMDVKDDTGTVIASFYNTTFPGIPGTGGHTDNFAVEVLGYLQLAKGTHVLGLSVSSDRTDVNNDDAYSLYVSANPRDFFATKIMEYQRAGAPFGGNQHIENQFTVEAPVAGIYPIRLVYAQTGLGANLVLYSIDESTSERIQMNDPSDPRTIKSYTVSSVAKASAPAVAEVSPLPGSEGIPAADAIKALLVDGKTTVSADKVKLFLNNVQVTPQKIAKTGNQLSVEYSPNASRPDKNNLVRLEFTDSANTTYTNSWQFGITVGGGSSTTVAGQWDFDAGDLRATVGKPLDYFDGANGVTKQGTRFGTTTKLGVADINGQAAKVMEVPGDLDPNAGYLMNHGIAPNGGGTRVNQWTLIMDVFVDTAGPGAASLIQMSSTNQNNGADGDLFWQGSNFGQGGSGYNGRGTFTAGAWHRVVAAYDEAASPPVVTKYVDGIKQDDWTANQGLDAPRRTLAPMAILFADGQKDERRKMWVNSIQIRAGKLSDAEMVALGGPSASGIPQVIPQSTVTGQWDFEFGDLGATIGKPLEYFDGADGLTKAGTEFGVTTDLGVSDINGQPAKVMKVPGDLAPNVGYLMDHRIAPNGGGTRVNQYTLIMDVYIATTGPGAASLIQVSSTNLDNKADGDLFWQGNNFGQGGGGYNGRGTFTAGAWHRVIAAYDEAASPPVVSKFVDGIKQDDWTANQGLDAPRRAMLAKAILFADGQADERRIMWVSSIQVRAGKISDAEAVVLGGPTASGIPVVIPKSNVTGQWDFTFGDLGATIGKPLEYFDGADGLTKAGTLFGTNTDLGIADLNGQPVRVMQVPGDLAPNVGYLMDHGISPNGGGTRVNQYTLIMDLFIDTAGPGAASLIQVSSTNLDNKADGDLFWQGGNFGQGGSGYNGTGIFTAGAWHRVIAAYDEAAKPPVVTKFVDGIKQDDWTANQGLDNPRRAMLPKAILFADGQADERRVMWVSSVQVRSGKLSDAEMVALGGPSASKIPVLITGVIAPEIPPSLSIGLSGGSVTISWPQDATGYKLESTSTLTSPSWTEVTGAANNSATVQVKAGGQFFRLKK